MKVFMLVDGNGRNVAATLQEGTAMDLMFSRAIDAGRVDMDALTFDSGTDTIVEVDESDVLDGLLTDFEINELDTNGLVLL